MSKMAMPPTINPVKGVLNTCKKPPKPLSFKAQSAVNLSIMDLLFFIYLKILINTEIHKALKYSIEHSPFLIEIRVMDAFPSMNQSLFPFCLPV